MMPSVKAHQSITHSLKIITIITTPSHTLIQKTQTDKQTNKTLFKTQLKNR
jgi:hypothetical protein